MPNPIENVLFRFTNDLRLHDNPALIHASQLGKKLACIYIVDAHWLSAQYLGLKRIGDKRLQFLHESLLALQSALRPLKHTLDIYYGDPPDILKRLILGHRVDALVQSRPAGYEEQQQISSLQSDCPNLHIAQIQTHTLLDLEKTQLDKAPLKHFTPFRKYAEALLAPKLFKSSELAAPRALAPRFPMAIHNAFPDHEKAALLIGGGEQEGLQHVANYFDSRAPSTYKKTRNALDGWPNSTKFSTWLSLGAISPRYIFAQLKHYESIHGANDSTYWIQFELLWRDYFYWYALNHGAKLFRFRGLNQHPPLTSFYAQRFTQWTKGRTPWPLVNALMTELNRTGYMSNRGRQIAASCLINELSVDWRYGAAYFEKQLLDYDVGSNWGNWQYIAGVGADPRGGRHFSIEKQTQQYDPDGVFVRKWLGDVQQPPQPIDSVDAADWPLT